MKTIINVECIDQDLIITNSPILASGGVHENFIKFKFCSKWDGLGKTAVFYRNEKEKYSSVVDIDGMCEIPHEVTGSEGFFFFGVFGCLGDAIKTSKVIKYKIKQGTQTESLNSSEEPTPDVYQQLLSAYGKADKKITQEVADREASILAEETARKQADETETTARKKADSVLEARMNTFTKVFNSVSEMKSDIRLEANCKVKTTGYYSINDGGNSEYVIRDEKPTKYYEILDNGLYAELITSKYLNVCAVGCVKNGILNSSKFNELSIKKHGLFIPHGRYEVDGTLKVYGTIKGEGVEYPTLNYKDGRVEDYRINANTVLYFPNTVKDCVCLYDGATANNLIIVGNSYTQSENRELARNGNEQEIFICTKNGEQNGLLLNDYGCECNNISCFNFLVGITIHAFARVSMCYATLCNTGFKVTFNDNMVNMCRTFACGLGFNISGTLNTINQCRSDSCARYGMYIGGDANDITSYCCDFSYGCAILLDGSSNAIDTLRFRCCAKYPNMDTPITTDNASYNCGIYIRSGLKNTIKNCPSGAPNIMDSDPALRSMNLVVGLAGGVTHNAVDFTGQRGTRELNQLIKCVDGNAPVTIFNYLGTKYYSNSFTQIDDINVLTTENYCNTKQIPAKKGNLHFDGVNWFVYNGRDWNQFTHV